MFFISTEKWGIVFNPWPKIIYSPKSGVETAILHGSDTSKIKDLQSRLRYVIHMNNVERFKKKRKKK